MERMAEDLSRYLRGWIGYFGKCETPSVLAGLEQWLRRRLRSAIWKQWKRRQARFTELRKRGVGGYLAGPTAGSAVGPSRLANSLALNIALSNAYLPPQPVPQKRLPVPPLGHSTVKRNECVEIGDGQRAAEPVERSHRIVHI